jgi:predicted ATPase
MMLDVQVLGEPDARIDGRDVPISSPKQRALLAILALHEGATVTPARLVELLWGDSPPRTVRKNLHVLVARLRSCLESAGADPSVIVSTDDGYALARSGVRIDSVVLPAIVDRAKGHGERGEWHECEELLEHVLADWSSNALGSMSTERWATEHALLLDDVRLRARELLVNARLALGHARAALEELAALAAEHPERSSLHRLRAVALYRAGRPDDAVATIQAALEAPPGGAAGHHAQELRELERQVVGRDVALDAVPVVVGPPIRPLPTAAHLIIDREREIACLDGMLRDGERLITIHGPGGTGKTRIAVELAGRRAARVEGVVWVDLAPLASAETVPTTIVTALGLTGGESDPVDAVAQSIGRRRIMLVLDNFEHVLAAAPLVERLVDACPRLAVVVTSRALLGVDSEQAFPLMSLSVPDDDALFVAGLDGPPAGVVRLFRDRARLVDGLVDDDLETTRSIAALCRAVDGLPLGIELAAARTALLTPGQVLDRLERRADLLRASNPTTPRRQRSLLDVVEWSYDLLDLDEQRLVRVLGIFVGGCALVDLERITGLSAGELEPRLDSLVARSLLVRSEDAIGRPRWRMLDTIATFARLRMRAEDFDEQELRRRFAEAMLDLARASNTHRPDAEHERSRLLVELPNVLAAIDWGIEHDPTLACQTYGSMTRYYLTRGALAEAAEVGERVIGACADVEAKLRIEVATLHGQVLFMRGDAQLGHAVLSDALQMDDDLIDTSHAGYLHAAFVDACRYLGDLEVAADHAAEALRLAVLSGDRWLEALGHAETGFVHLEAEQRAHALNCFRIARRIFVELEDEYWTISMDSSAAMQVLFDDADPRHLELVEASAHRAEQLGYHVYAAHLWAVWLRGVIELGQIEDAAKHGPSILQRISAAGDVPSLTFAVSCLSVAEWQAGRAEDAELHAASGVRLACGSGGTAFVDYPLTVLAASYIRSGAVDDALVALAAIEPTRLIEGYSLDRDVVVILGGVENEIRGIRGDDAIRELVDDRMQFEPSTALQAVVSLLDSRARD